MKTLRCALLFMAAMLLAGTLHAQVQKTHMSEDFESQSLSSGWSLGECTPITSGTKPRYVYQISDGVSTWGGWCYDPNKQIINGTINTKLDGTYTLVTKPFTMPTTDLNTILFDYWYVGTASNDAQNRLFGVSARVSGEEWIVLDSIKDMPADEDGMTGRKTITLNEDFSGKEIQLQFFFRNKHDENAYFMFLLDNIFFINAKDAPYPTADIETEFYTVEKPEDNVTLDITLRNSGIHDISSCEYAYTTNNSTQVEKLNFNFTKALAPITGQNTSTASVKFANGQFGKNSIKMWLVKINGSDFTATGDDTIRHQISLIDQSKLTQNLIPMMECFTASSCGYCKPLNDVMNPVLKNFMAEGKINVVKYQMNFPGSGDKYYIASNTTRMQYYDQMFGWGGYWGVPTPIFNGQSNIFDWPGETYADVMNQLKQHTEAAHAEKAFVNIVVKSASIDATTGMLDFEIEATSAVNLTANMVVLVTEKTTTGNRGSNGEREFHHVNMSAPLGANGKTCSFKVDSVVRVSGSVDMGTTHMEEANDLEIVCFVQAPLLSGGRIFQSASADVNALNVANEDRLAAAISVYPNPAKNNVSIKGLENANVSVFDLTGRMVYSTKAAEESLNMDLIRFTAGTYMIRIEQNGNTIHKKLVVTK